MPHHNTHQKRHKSSLPPRQVKIRSRSTQKISTTETDRTPEKPRPEMSDFDYIIGTSGGLNEMTPEGRQFQKAFNSFVFVVAICFPILRNNVVVRMLNLVCITSIVQNAGKLCA